MSAAHAQQWNPQQYAENARFVSDLGAPVIELLAPQPGERILDLGSLTTAGDSNVYGLFTISKMRELTKRSSLRFWKQARR
jgi:hypothetical protein